MDRLCRQFLAAAGLAPDQHRRAGAGHLADLAPQALDRQAVPFQAHFGQQSTGRRGLGQVAQRSPAVGMAQGMLQAHRIDRQGVIVVAMVAHQAAAGRCLQYAWWKHADPVGGPVLLQETVDFVQAVERGHQHADGKCLAAQGACGRRQGLDGMHLPAMPGRTQLAHPRFAQKTVASQINAQQLFCQHSASVLPVNLVRQRPAHLVRRRMQESTKKQQPWGKRWQRRHAGSNAGAALLVGAGWCG